MTPLERHETPFVDIPSHWQLVRLADITTKIGSGATPRGGKEVYLHERINFALIRSQNIFDRYFDATGLAFISDEHADELKNVWLESGDVLLNITGDGITFARSAIVPGWVLPACVNQHVSIIRVKPDVCLPGYLVSYLTHPEVKPYIESFNAGGSRRAITKGHIESFVIPLPPLPEQRAIAEILGSLDDKIEANRRQNETLEVTARVIFQSWFVDFDPVHAKAHGETPLGMDAETAALFPDSFEESVLGLIPRGWGVMSIGDAVKAVGGSTPSTAEPAFWDDGTIHWATPKDLSKLSSPVLLDTDRRITELGLQQISSGLLPKGTLLLSSRAPVGYLAIAEIPVAINQGFIAMICDEGFPSLYALFWTEANLDVIKNRASGTTFQEISKQNFRPILALVPSSDVLREFVKIVEPLYRQIVRSLEESRALAETRDALLPRLVSGVLRVGDVEVITESTS